MVYRDVLYYLQFRNPQLITLIHMIILTVVRSEERVAKVCIICMYSQLLWGFFTTIREAVEKDNFSSRQIHSLRDCYRSNDDKTNNKLKTLQERI